MALLSAAERFEAWAEAMREQALGTWALSKPELRAAVDAIDQWVEDNVISFNQSIPLPARTALTPRQKAWILLFVVARRARLA